ncbi:MAG: SdrD B-like domain-containing protein [Bacteroidota bacterium]
MLEEPPSSDRTDYPFSSTITNYAGSGVDLTVEIKQPQRGDAESHVSPGQRCGCTFDDELGPYFSCGEVFRNWKSTGETAGVPDTIIFSFSEPILIDRLGFGGFRTRSATDPAVAEFTFFSGPNATGEKVVSNLSDPGSTAMINTGDPLDPNAAINILQDQGGQTTSLYNGTYYYISNERSTRGWTILNMDTVLVQSLLWTQYNSTSDDPMDALDNIIGGSPNNSGYIGNLDIFRCESCPSLVSLGSTVFTDLNNNGEQDAGEMGIEGVPVQLFAANGIEVEVGPDGILGTADDAPGGMLTDPMGDYFFQDLEEGDYYVQIPATAFDMGAGALEEIPISSNTSSGLFTGETDPDDNTDNDDEGFQIGGSGTVVISDTITLTGGGEPTDLDRETAQGNMQDSLDDASGNMTLDFGFFAPVAVGDTAFVDLNGDGLQTPGEPGIAGVTVVLLDAGGDTVMVDAAGNAITGITTTAADGSYGFDNLPPGAYRVVFDISTAADADFYDFTTPNVGDDAEDSDNTIALTDSTAQSDPTPFLNSGEEDLTLDVGLICNIEVTVASPFAVCSTQPIDLTVGASVTPDTTATFGAAWTTPDGSGDFLDAAGNVLTTEPYRFGTAAAYRPSAADAHRGEVTLVLTTDDPDGPCEPVSNSVTIQILKVDCGQFMWDGQDD